MQGEEGQKASHYSYYFNQYLVHNVGWEEAGIATLVYYGWRNGGVLRMGEGKRLMRSERLGITTGEG